MLSRKVPPEVQRPNVGIQQFLFALVLLGKEFFNYLGVNLQQHT